MGFLAYKAWEISYHSLLVLSPFCVFERKYSEQEGIMQLLSWGRAKNSFYLKRGQSPAFILREGKKVDGTRVVILPRFQKGL